MDGNIAATYTLVYNFLKKQSHRKAAEAVKKAAKDFVVLRDDIEQEGPQLEDIVKQWKAKQNAKPEAPDSSSESSSDESDSSSDSDSVASSSSILSSSSDSSSGSTSSSKSEGDDTSDSDDSSNESDGGAIADKVTKKPTDRDTSATLSSAGENVKEVCEKPDEKSAKEDEKESDSGSSDSDSSDSESSDSEPSSTSSDSSSSSDSDGDAKPTKKEQDLPRNIKATKSASSGSSESSPEPEDKGRKRNPKMCSTDTSEGSSVAAAKLVLRADTRVAQVAKKRKTSETGAAITTAVADESQENVVFQRGGKPPRRVNERFQRIKPQDITPELLLDNNYDARGGTANDYGEKAHRDLIVTRGAGFRKEKNKKKRGSYRGGEITMENHSIKFDF
ncbi:hypothetical protein PAXRUDRAFT_828150 [Paxillus rubicundulus Ve08.2h10]|uniref:Srp40 C-terminal domain-containing protein n=1 Tax=Paxillus rubicundulus Ve08.2h10 TaxID=930991 RepID=A0A0D0DQ22_9AGAM|nr:hypothetical protein PAXRUDRAFT_828150 [Paxillus rubicundulus Ve08.2h10]